MLGKPGGYQRWTEHLYEEWQLNYIYINLPEYIHFIKAVCHFPQVLMFLECSTVALRRLNNYSKCTQIEA